MSNTRMVVVLSLILVVSLLSGAAVPSVTCLDECGESDDCVSCAGDCSCTSVFSRECGVSTAPDPGDLRQRFASHDDFMTHQWLLSGLDRPPEQSY